MKRFFKKKQEEQPSISPERVQQVLAMMERQPKPQLTPAEANHPKD